MYAPVYFISQFLIYLFLFDLMIILSIIILGTLNR